MSENNDEVTPAENENAENNEVEKSCASRTPRRKVNLSYLQNYLRIKSSFP